MDKSKVPQLDAIGATIRKKRTQPSRRRHIPDGESLPDRSPMSSTPVSDDMSKVSSDENMDDNSGGKMFNLNQCVSRSLPVIESNVMPCSGASGKPGNENRLKKVKLKVGGVTRTIQANGASVNSSPVNTNQSSDSTQHRQRLIYEGTSDEYRSVAMDKRSGLQGIPWKDFSKNSFSIGREEMVKTSVRNAVESKGDKSEASRKSKRVRKRRVLDDDFDEEAEDDEIRYLEKLKTSKMAGYKDLEMQPERKHQKGGKSDNLGDSVKLGVESKKSRSGDTDYEEEDEAHSDGKPDDKKKKKPKKELSELQADKKKETALTTRQRALLSKDSSSATASQIEFPNGLPPVPNRKSKEKLSEVEQQLKKAEAAQRRRLQNEKAARESEEEAIRKILGQDSSRKKREEKIKKRQEELAQEKVSTALMLASNTIRTVMGPNGTTVTFPQEMGFPKIFEPRTCSYPPPREMCAGPSCSNPYKYRDSKSMLPLCSLQCYKGINDGMGAGKTC